MANTVKASNRVFQCGSQQRSDVRFRKACEIVRNGGIGKLETVLVGLPGGTPDIGHTGDRQDPEPVPEGFNYEMWLGPAPEAPYAPGRCHVNFRWILDYSGGQITDWGGHHPDIAQWGMGTELTGPTAIRNGQAQWAKEKLWNTAVDYYFEAHYASGVTMRVSSRLRGGVTFQGSDGSVWVNRGAIEATPQALLDWQPKENDLHLYRSDNHARNFIDCVISRKETAAPIEQAHRSITIAHLGNISLRLGRDISGTRPPSKSLVTNPPVKCCRGRCASPGRSRLDVGRGVPRGQGDRSTTERPSCGMVQNGASGVRAFLDKRSQ